MQIQTATATELTLSLNSNEVGLIRQALNEICHGVDFDDAEFEARIGYTRAVAIQLLDGLIAADDSRPGAK